MSKRVGVILSGCGVFDGSEIHEAVSILVALDRRGAEAVCFAPDIAQSGVINHLTHKPETMPRNVLVESARIARGKVHSLALARAVDLDALVFPGGFGAAKNLSTFAADGVSCRVNDDVARLLREMHAAGKPVGLACIAPVLAAAVFGAAGLDPVLTIGSDAETAEAIVGMGGRHERKSATDVCVDRANLLVTTPCYMTATGPWEVFQGADRLVEELLALT